MASMAMTSSVLGSTMALSKLPSTRRVTVMAKASTLEATEIKGDAREESSSKRRDLVFAAAAAAACSIARVAMADEEPKRGTAEAKKKYGPVCVANPTARICRN